jgi:hypothetical protein
MNGKLNGWLPHIIQLVTTILGLWLLLNKVPTKGDITNALVPVQTSIAMLTGKVNALETHIARIEPVKPLK